MIVIPLPSYRRSAFPTIANAVMKASRHDRSRIALKQIIDRLIIAG